MAMERQNRVLHSALWAAAGDALGWMTELGGEHTVEARTGHRTVDRPVAWKRRIGGRAGVLVDLPAGTYSDDTQLRLAVCRSIRGDGVFDPEAFAKVELTVWQSYALGAGLGSKAAASNLARRGVNWYSNFFDGKAQSYKNAGGNGAAMRVQPHVWVNKHADDALLPTLRDALITHGHPHGFAGAVFHALSLADAVEGKHLHPTDWSIYSARLRSLPAIASTDRHLEGFWRPAWEALARRSFTDAVHSIADELERDLEIIRPMVIEGVASSYPAILQALNLYDAKYRGSGLKTAIAALALAWICRNDIPEVPLTIAANELGSDTDTIGTMVGALVGARAVHAPDWVIQDRDYIEMEAVRLAKIAEGAMQDGFAYPDLSKWSPPSNQSDAVAKAPGSFALPGLGLAEPDGEEYRAGDAIWQWLRLPFGQTVFAKRRPSLEPIGLSQLPTDRRSPVSRQRSVTPEPAEPSLPIFDVAREAADIEREGARVTNARGAMSQAATRVSAVPRDQMRSRNQPPFMSLDRLTDQVIRSDFDPRMIGAIFNDLVERSGSIDEAIAFAAIIAKARLSRFKRYSR